MQVRRVCSVKVHFLPGCGVMGWCIFGLMNQQLFPKLSSSPALSPVFLPFLFLKKEPLMPWGTGCSACHSWGFCSSVVSVVGSAEGCWAPVNCVFLSACWQLPGLAHLIAVVWVCSYGAFFHVQTIRSYGYKYMSILQQACWGSSEILHVIHFAIQDWCWNSVRGWRREGPGSYHAGLGEGQKT